MKIIKKFNSKYSKLVNFKGNENQPKHNWFNIKEVKELEDKIVLLTEKVLKAKSEEVANAYERQIETAERQLALKKQENNRKLVA